MRTHLRRCLGLSLCLGATGCATKHYGRLTSLTDVERSQLTCREINLEIAKVNGFIDHVNKESEFDGRDVLAVLGDFGIGNGLERSDAIKSANKRLEELNTLKTDKNCP